MKAIKGNGSVVPYAHYSSRDDAPSNGMKHLHNPMQRSY